MADLRGGDGTADAVTAAAGTAVGFVVLEEAPSDGEGAAGVADGASEGKGPVAVAGAGPVADEGTARHGGRGRHHVRRGRVKAQVDALDADGTTAALGVGADADDLVAGEGARGDREAGRRHGQDADGRTIDGAA